MSYLKPLAYETAQGAAEYHMGAASEAEPKIWDSQSSPEQGEVV